MTIFAKDWLDAEKRSQNKTIDDLIEDSPEDSPEDEWRLVFFIWLMYEDWRLVLFWYINVNFEKNLIYTSIVFVSIIHFIGSLIKKYILISRLVIFFATFIATWISNIMEFFGFLKISFGFLKFLKLFLKFFIFL